MAQYVMGIDVGTTGTKAVIFDMSGRSVSSAYSEYVCEYPQPNWVEQDAAMLKSTLLRLCAEAVKDSDVNREEIVSVAVSAQRCSVLFIDENDEVMKMISWLDNRPDEEVAFLERQVGATRFYNVTGMPLATTWILPKILWMQKHEPEIWGRAKRVVQLHDYILHCLGTEDYYGNEADSAFWGFWETDKLDWHFESLEAFGIAEKQLPRVKPPGTPVGTMPADIAKAMGLSEKTLLCVGAGDQNCAAIGAGVVRAGTASVSLGTGGLATVFTKKPFRDPRGKTMVTNSAVHGNWQLEGLQNGAAGVFRWFRDEIAALEKKEAEQAGKDAYEYINRMIEASPPGGRGLVFLPYLASAASPRYDQNARGSLIGLTFLHNRGDIARAVVEGITLEQKDILTSMRKAGVKIEKIRIMGGATKSGLWNQLQADCYGCPVETLKITDAAVMGAALCAAVGAGIYPGIPEAADALVNADVAYEPRAEMVGFYDESYRLYCDAYEGLSGTKVFEGIAERQKIKD